jgi:hypothetical protein
LQTDEDVVRSGWRQRWKGDPTYHGEFTNLGYSGGYGSSPFRARLLPSGNIGFIKRAINAVGIYEGAHEFIASELAYHLGVPVPPVGFCYDNEGGKFVISIRAYEEISSYKDIKFSPTDIQALNVTFSESAVFHTWIAEADHAANPENIVANPRAEDGKPQVSFIDHAMCLTSVWHAAHPPATFPSEYYIGANQMVRESVLDAIRRVDRVSERVLESIISRVPPSLLPPAEAKAIHECLRRRSGELRSAFAIVLGEAQ